MSTDAESPVRVDDATDESPAGTDDVDAGDDEGYVHRPDGTVHPDAVDREWDWRGWVVVAVVAFSFLVVPVVIVYRPPSLPYWVGLLALPMLPALLLGLVAVWGTTRP